MVSAVIKTAKRYGAAILGVPVKATIKKVISYQLSHASPAQAGVVSQPRVEKTLKRDNLWEIQTPQGFKKDLILKAYKKFANIPATDDASLVEKLGRRVKVVMGSYFNLKVTTPEDLVLAEAIAQTFEI
jgi:2-C-methyl-D-erythritol 4-phosphate cytidylyltransferase